MDRRWIALPGRRRRRDRFRAQPMAPGCLLGFGLWGVLFFGVVVLWA